MKIFDISLPVDPQLPVWPGDPKIVLERHRAISRGHASNDSKLACSVHSGTHVDAPAHFIRDGLTVEQLPLDVLIGPAYVADLPEADTITPDSLEALELSRETTRLLIKTRNSALWSDPHHQFNPDFVAITADAANWVVKKGIRLIGIDYLSIQRYKDSEPLTHRILLDAGVVIVEGLCLQNIHAGLYKLICLPIKLVGSEGAPARTVLIEE
ncbi:MAG: cyclase family protein [Desulfobacteraceae bacterium]|jgi:arylformamidase|nr:cyclase family protein [Desulfobacteraceae bacterium]